MVAGRVYIPVPEAPSAVSGAIFTRGKKRVFWRGEWVIDLRGR
nr:MAG TPA: hypothetical protein [Siphoviridae sp. ctRJB2]